MPVRVNKGKRRLVISFSVLAVLSFGVWIHLAHQRPVLSWKGHPSTYWIGRLSFHDLDNGEVSAEEFLFAAGKGVVPELIRGLHLRDNWLSDKWTDMYFKLGKWQRFFKMPVKRSEYRANCARALGLLGAAASEAEPALLQCLKDKDLSVRREAAEALGRIADDKSRVAPALVAGLASTDQNYRLACIIGLIYCLPGSTEAAKALR